MAKAHCVFILAGLLVLSGCGTVSAPTQPTDPDPSPSVESLEEAFEAVVDALNSGDLDAFTRAWHSEGVLLTRNQPFPLDRADFSDAEWKELFSEFQDQDISLSYTLVNIEYRVIGDVGIVWGRSQLLFESSLEDQNDQTVRHLSTLRYQPTGWKIISWSDSALPERLANRSPAN